MERGRCLGDGEETNLVGDSRCASVAWWEEVVRGVLEGSLPEDFSGFLAAVIGVA